jgi:NAD(P)-dependent dehydrogenase (short-subunit alcohol dehydrogenase family)
MQSLKNQRVIVTGGSSGLGLGVVEALAASTGSRRRSACRWRAAAGC